MLRCLKFTVLISFLILAPSNLLFSQNTSSTSSFGFAFLTDIHIAPERNAPIGFQKAINTFDSMNPEFILTGGDLIMDALGTTYGRADSLYDLYLKMTSEFRMPVYNTMGNHEIFGIYDTTFSHVSNLEYGEKMYENRIGESYYSFMHKGWKFMVINSIEDTKHNSYIGLVDSVQINWIKQELEKTSPQTPIVVSTHIPLITVYTQIYEGSTLPNDSALVVVNGKEVVDLFSDHNLKLVLQGHLHTVEDIYINGTHFITGGAISASWWRGPYYGFEEGFIWVDVKDDEFSWKYIDYGWETEDQSISQ